MHDQLERYTADQLLAPAAQTTILRQTLHRAGVHWHDYYELVYVVEGTAEHVVNGVPHPIGPGSLFLLTPAVAFVVDRAYLFDGFFVWTAGYAVFSWFGVRPDERRAFYAEHRRWRAAVR